MNNTFWRDKKVLLTGHTGFKGAWMSLCLQYLGARIIGYSLAPPTSPNLFELTNVAENMLSITGDVRDLARLKKVILEHEPEIVIHMAAQSLVRESYREPYETYSTNVMGTVCLFEAARQSEHVKVIVNVTSDKCYENKEWYWGYRENEPLCGADPYSNSKSCAELVTYAYRHSFFQAEDILLASVRAGNVIGGGDWAKDRLLPDIFRALIKNEKVVIRNPNAIRPWQHVLEPVSAYLMLAEKLYNNGQQFADAWNFGPSDEDARPVGWIVEQVAKLWGKSNAWEINETKKDLKESRNLMLDCSKARMELGWAPKWCLNVALAKTVDWYRVYANQEDMAKLTRLQIADYYNN